MSLSDILYFMTTKHFSNSTRTPAVAGRFYPNDKGKLSATIHSLLHDAAQYQSVKPYHKEPSNIIIAPHAGYIYSGPIAASAYHYVKNSSKTINRVILLGPAHRVPIMGCVCPSVAWFETPLGKTAIDQEQLRKLVSLNLIQINDLAHQEEHSLEVHLPFLQTLYGSDFCLIPLVVGDCRPETLAKIINSTINEHSVLIVSTDLSHFMDYQSATIRDTITSNAIVSLDFSSIGPEDACGCVPLSGLLSYAKSKKIEMYNVDYRNSGDTAGDKHRVVGYGAYVAY